MTQGRHQEWSLRLNLIQHGKTHVAIFNHAASEVVFPPLHPDTLFQPCGFFFVIFNRVAKSLRCTSRHKNALRDDRNTCSSVNETRLKCGVPCHFVCFGLCVLFSLQRAEKGGTSTTGQPAVHDREKIAEERGTTTVFSSTAISTDAAE